MPPEYRKIVDEIYTALENLNAPPLLLGIVGSWGDTENAQLAASGMLINDCGWKDGDSGDSAEKIS
jgi:hypothetical protein